jgi:hypothetical protein
MHSDQTSIRVLHRASKQVDTSGYLGVAGRNTFLAASCSNRAGVLRPVIASTRLSAPARTKVLRPATLRKLRNYAPLDHPFAFCAHQLSHRI